MAYPQLRSMNADLQRGAYMDGQVKMLRPDSSASLDSQENYAAKRDLSLPYYGFGQPREVNIPGTNRTVPTPDFVPNELAGKEATGILGQTW